MTSGIIVFHIAEMHHTNQQVLRSSILKIYDYPIVELERAGETYRIPTRLDWRVMLVLAQIGGWEPDDRGDYDSTYLLAPGVIISDEEADKLRDALENILDDVPDFDIPLTGKIIPLEYFSGIRKYQIKAFVEFCERGGFEVL
jgi:hypothetical protein